MFRSLAIALMIVFPHSTFAALPEGIEKVSTVEGITEYRLKNGLQVLLIPDVSQPKVTVNLTLFVGSRHEGYGETGMAHLLEHMLFKGSPLFPDVPKALRDHGAQFNGTTWLDRTNYYETMPATEENLQFALELEADRMTNSFVKREDLISEMTVVRNEFEMGENRPESILWQRMMASAFEWHNYGKSTIGNRTDIERVPIDSLQAFYKKYYRPSNAMLVIAGKFDEAKALELIAKNFGKLKNPDEPLPKTYTEEPAQDGERQVMLRRVGTVGAVGAVYHVPAGSDPEYPAVSVLEGALTTEPAGRLYKSLVETKKATSEGGFVFPAHDPGAMILLAQTDASKTEEAREAMLDTLENVGKNPITNEEVERVKRELLKDREQLMSNSQRLAVQLSEWAAAGSWKLFFLYRDRLEKVTAAEVNSAAAKYLVRSNRTVGVYLPTKQAERATIPPRPDALAMVKDYQGRQAIVSGEAFDPTPENVEKRVVRGSVGEGVKSAMLAKKTRGETVNVILNLRFGSEEALKGKTAVVPFLGTMLTRGTKTKTRQQIKDEFDKLNAAINVNSGLGVLSVNLQTKRANLSAVLALLGEVLREPSFPNTEFELLKRETIDNAEKERTDPQMLAFVALRRRVSPYPPENIRYVPTVQEDIDRTKLVTVDQIKALYDALLGSAAGELAIVGDFEAEAAVGALNKFLKGWKNGVPYQRIDNVPVVTLGGVEKIQTPDKENAVYAAGLSLSLNDADPEYPAMAVGNYVLGAAPLASRLSNRVRGKDGLSYGVGSGVRAGNLDRAGSFTIFAITNPVNMQKVQDAIAEELKKFLSDGVSASELDGAKKAYLQSLQVARGNDSTLASQLASTLRADRTFAFYAAFDKAITALQPGEVKAAFDKLVDPKHLAIIEAGDFNKK